MENYLKEKKESKRIHVIILVLAMMAAAILNRITNLPAFLMISRSKFPYVTLRAVTLGNVIA